MNRLVRRDIRRALAVEAVLEAGNDVVKTLKGQHAEGAEAYNIIKSSLETHLIVILGRLLDNSREKMPLAKRDSNCIPYLMEWLAQPGCCDALVKRAAKHWRFGPSEPRARGDACRSAVDGATSLYTQLSSSARWTRAVTTMREFRHNYLAHSLGRKITSPVYKELFYLGRESTLIAAAVNHAVLGLNEDLAAYGELHREEADAFWGRALPATVLHP
ncbi:AbiU2 domain-containing protein [Inquilinus sp. CA228]|uniref:AbiU2 domain-containing protein n=1 Tax=Inquilinus sp. CA228 TaxID=3455609 RepID=UPI003F8D098F